MIAHTMPTAPVLNQISILSVKLAFHNADTDTDILATILVRVSARVSVSVSVSVSASWNSSFSRDAPFV